MDDDKLLHELTQHIMQDVSYRLGDLINAYGAELQVFVLAVMGSLVDSLVPMLDELDRKVYDHLRAHTETAVMDKRFDPRGRGK